VTTAAFVFDEDPDNPGWHRWRLSDATRYNEFLGPLLVRRNGNHAHVRMTPVHKHSNLSGAVHGGTILGFIDVALFAASRVFGLIEAGTAVTLDLSVQFIGAGRTGQIMEADVELLRETGRLLFLRGLVTQDDDKIAAFSGTIRKPTAR
jgi:uncharacterized protein (TIGR00369 family)